jgi:cobalt/nickel transport system permease protein
MLALLALLLTLATAHRAAPALAAELLVLLVAGFLWAGIPVLSALARALVVLSFSLPLALVSLLAGEPGRAAALLLKSYVSALAVLLVVATTPVAVLLRGLEAAGLPRFLLMVAQFLYRYLFVVSEEAQHMRRAALSRGSPARRAGFRAAAGAIGALFARSYGRAEEIHRAMLARGFSGRFPTLHRLRFTAADALFASAASVLPVAARVAAERLAA